MKISTKTVATLLVAATVAAAIPGISQISMSKKRRESQFDKLLQRHDRKGELRAELLGITAYDLRRLLRIMSFDDVLNSCGISSKRAFRLALVGRLRDELLRRGWSRARIETYVMRRSVRLA